MVEILAFTLGFKAIFWDSGAIWALMLIMSVVWIINTLHGILEVSKKMSE